MELDVTLNRNKKNKYHISAVNNENISVNYVSSEVKPRFQPVTSECKLHLVQEVATDISTAPVSVDDDLHIGLIHLFRKECGAAVNVGHSPFSIRRDHTATTYITSGAEQVIWKLSTPQNKTYVDVLFAQIFGPVTARSFLGNCSWSRLLFLVLKAQTNLALANSKFTISNQCLLLMLQIGINPLQRPRQ